MVEPREPPPYSPTALKNTDGEAAGDVEKPQRQVTMELAAAEHSRLDLAIRQLTPGDLRCLAWLNEDKFSTD